MSGFLWISSYVILCSTVSVLTLAVISLLRRAAHDASFGSRRSAWPIGAISPGAALPQFRLEGVAVSDSSNVLRDGLIVFATGETDAFAAAVAVTQVANAWGLDFTIIVRPDPWHAWVDDLPADTKEHLVWSSDKVFRAIVERTSPIIALVRAGRLLEAVAGSPSPATLRNHFKMAAEPLQESRNLA